MVLWRFVVLELVCPDPVLANSKYPRQLFFALYVIMGSEMGDVIAESDTAFLQETINTVLK